MTAIQFYIAAVFLAGINLGFLICSIISLIKFKKDNDG